MPSCFPPLSAVRWLLLVILLGCGFAAQAVSLPAAAVGAQQQQKSVSSESTPSEEDKKAGYAALAEILENDSARQQLVKQLRDAGSQKSESSTTPVIVPPEPEEKTVLQSLTELTRQYGGAFASQFVRLHNNIVSAPHKSFNKKTFFNALNHFLMLAAALFAIYWLMR